MSRMTLLDSLRWKEDCLITNYQGQRVWLREVYDANGRRIGITDCCPEGEPCRLHAELSKSTDAMRHVSSHTDIRGISSEPKHNSKAECQ